MGPDSLYAALYEGNTPPTQFEETLSEEVLWLIREILEANTGYRDLEDKKASARRILTKAFSEYRAWIKGAGVEASPLPPVN